ncbi:MAG: bifunctional class I SAM-dependent methyltransferase/GNAT family N-acetyltransferase [Sulfuricellaceae bacterium]
MNSSVAYKDFTFPLNVYAHVLEKEEGQVNYLHYGLFDHEGVSAGEAQDNSTKLLWQHLPPPCKLLEVGIGLGTTLARLCSAGYGATGITPDASQIVYAKKRYGDYLPAVCSKLEDYIEASGQWDAMLFQESAQYVDPVDLFEAASRLLVADGKMVVLDEFALRRTESHKEGLHDLEHFLRLAERAGFTLETRIDLSLSATPTLDWLLAAVKRHSDSLRRELGVAQDTLDALEASNNIYHEKYANGQFGYFLLSFKRASLPTWKVGRLLPERSPEMRALFSEVFGHEMSADHWHWKYGDGRGSGIGVWRAADGKLVAHYGGVSRDILLCGRPARAFQACDLMVGASERGSFTRKGPAFLATATFLERELGYGAPHLLGCGFPTERAYRLPERLGLYVGSVGAIQELVWPTENSKTSPFWKIREISLATRKEQELADACWKRMAADLTDRIVGVRDAAYLTHRYLGHPDKSYRIFAVRRRFGFELAGLFVVRVVDAERCELLDTIGPLAHIPLLVRFARQVAKDAGCRELFIWTVNNITPDFGPCPRIIDLPVTVPGNNWTFAPANESIAGRWWLTSGDTDFR